MTLYSVTARSVVITGLTFGTTYHFKVQAENDFSLSEFSSVLSLVAATTPAAPLLPITSVVADRVIINWTQPSARGNPITGYKVYIRKSDLSFERESA